MPLSLVRLDDRLIHGQVIAVWLRAIPADRIVIVDDRTARDEFLREVLTLAAPPNVPVEVHDVVSGISRLADLAAATDRVIVLLRQPGAALELRRAGVPFDVLDVGGLGAGPGRRALYRTISASTDELAAFRELETLGTRVELQIVPDDRPIPFRSIDPAA